MKLIALAGVACIALTAAACSEREGDGPVDKVQDAASAPVGQVSAATMGANLVSAYVPNAAMADMYEIQAADMAIARSQNAQVKEMAQMIKTDHTAAAAAMKGMVPQAAPGIEVPTALDQRRQGMIDNLRDAQGADFDRTYVAQQVAAHQEALTLHRGFSDNTDAPQLAAHARMVVPKIEAHLQMAQRIQGTLGGAQ
jgi:putative membrane protein